MKSRTVEEARVLQEVGDEELRSLRNAPDDILCFERDSDIEFRLQLETVRCRVDKNGLTGWCRIVSGGCAAVHSKDVRVHFCKYFPCHSTFHGHGNVEPPLHHLAALRLVPTGCDKQEADIGIGGASTAGPCSPCSPSAPALSPPKEPTVPALPALAEPLPNQISRIATLAEAWAPSFNYVGPFAFLVWAVQEKKDVRLWLWEDQFVDIVTVWAPWARSGASSAADWPRVEVVFCKLECVGKNGCVTARMAKDAASMNECNHYMPVVPIPWGRRNHKPDHPPCNGTLCSVGIGNHCMAQLMAQCARVGKLPFRSVADGNCAFDTMLFLSGRQRSEVSRRRIRTEIVKAMRQVAGNPAWESVCMQIEGDNAATPPKPLAPAEPLPVAAAPICDLEQQLVPLNTCDQYHFDLVKKTNDLKKAIDDCHPPEPAPIAASHPPALAEPLPIAASLATATPHAQPNLDAAILQKMGLKRLSAWESQMLLEKLPPAVLKSLAETSAEAPIEGGGEAAPPLHVSESRKDEHIGTKRKHCEMVATYAAAHGFESKVTNRAPPNFWKGFFKEVYKCDLAGHGSDSKRKMYWVRRLREAQRPPVTGGIAAARHRLTGRQGRPILAPCIEEEVVKWFANVRRRGGRVTRPASQ